MLRLKEHPIEWIKFTTVMGLVLNIVLWLLWWKGRVPMELPVGAVCVGVSTIITSLICPRWFRGFYRVGMTVCFHLGQIMGKLMLIMFFFVVLTPLGLMLRLAGKDLLNLKPNTTVKTWWHPAKNKREFDRMF